jgi:hypothetical protein
MLLLGGMFLRLLHGNQSRADLADVQLQPVPAAPAGTAHNGLLLDGPISKVTVPDSCEKPHGADDQAHAKCVAAAVAGWQQQANSRQLLQGSADGLSLTGSSQAANDDISMFGTTAVKLAYMQRTDDGSLTEREVVQLLANGRTPLEEIVLQLQDALGRPLGAGTTDAGATIVVSCLLCVLPQTWSVSLGQGCTWCRCVC